ncbi:MAG: hypothetical protein H6865_06965 [Rhodospirillales bacterium]|nr:hypothetical protein [Alphaproteobacteria bacterium]MCB9987357.1 hypothetical protein [Rhodospirillales bacterium]USO07794.1 MAG: hypothetical protein H6866_00740 [Rhodospirillales bacterium]
MGRLLFLVVLLSSGVVCAMDKVEREALPSPGQGQHSETSPARQVDMAASPEDEALMLCQTVQMMSAQDGGGKAGAAGPDYQPGVDAYGRPVVPAEGIAQPVFDLPDRIDIPLNIDLLKKVGIINAPTPDLGTNVGTVSISKGGQVTFNGQDTTASLQSYCAAHYDPKKAEQK